MDTKTKSKRGLYSKFERYAERSIEVLVDIMEHGENSAVRLGAAKVILNKVLPDLKAVAVESSNDEKPVVVLRIPSELADKYGIQETSQEQIFITN